MIAIKFHPQYEDRISLFFKSIDFNAKNISVKFTDTPLGLDEGKCYWIIKYYTANQVNYILNNLIEMKSVMGVEDLKFSFAKNESEYYTQYSCGQSIPWFNL
jgi:hypothetical protein